MGGETDYADLDHAATAPCLAAVRDAVEEFLPWYSSAHRGAGFPSQVSTRVYERTREVLRRFVDARGGDAVIFTRNTTDALNLLARSLPRHTSVVLFDTEHHAALLPWRGPNVHRLALPRTRSAAVSTVDRALAGCPEGPRLVVLAGASNVTGETLPVAEIAAVARRHGARTALDAAQLAPHRATGGRRRLRGAVRALALRALRRRCADRARRLAARGPALPRGWRRDEVRDPPGLRCRCGLAAGPRTVRGRLAQHCGRLRARRGLRPPVPQLGEAVTGHEHELLGRLPTGLAAVPGLTELQLFDEEGGRTGTVGFVLEGIEPGWLAAVLSAEYGIGVRDGAFCAHIATQRLVGRTGSGGRQALRVSLGLGTTAEHVDRLVTALQRIVARGITWTYARPDGRWGPVPDPRGFPPFLAG